MIPDGSLPCHGVVTGKGAGWNVQVQLREGLAVRFE